MGLFGRIFRKSGEQKRDGSQRCMECGMTGGEHTDWCTAASEGDRDVAPDPTSEERAEAEGRTESHL